MNIIPFLKSDAVIKIVSDQNTVRIKQQQASFNLFTISSYNSYIENFHSDIIASLLNPNAPHSEQYSFLHLFIDYLNRFHGLMITKDDYKNVDVRREKGKLDIWIKDITSKKAIIIENKINFAPDMDDQIGRYWKYSEADNKFIVEAIVYLTLDGTKKAPPTDAAISHLVKNIEAFTDKTSDLLTGWLEPCLLHASNQDSFSFLFQYIKLIKHLAHRSMESQTMEELYQLINSEDGFKTLEAIVSMYADLKRFRADKFGYAVNDYAPFKKQIRYKPWYWIYDVYIYKDQQLKLDVWFEDFGGAEIVFWNVSTEGVNGRLILTELLKDIGLIQEFTDEISYHSNGYSKHFIIGNGYESMVEIDNAILKFVKELLVKLNNFWQVEA